MMFNHIQYARTLDYCDGILLFEGNDPIGGTYVGSYLEQVEGGDDYLVVGCRPEMLRLFRHGACDLLELLTASAVYGWCVASLLGTKRPLTVKGTGAGDIPNEYLPEPGYMIFDSEVNHGVVADAAERNNFVLQVSIEPPRTGRGRAVEFAVVEGLMDRVQDLARCAVKEVAGSRGVMEASRLGLVGMSEGSVVVTLEAAAGLDERRESALAQAFEWLDSLFDKMEVSQQLDVDMAEYAPATVEAYARLMKLLKDKETGFHYTWAAPDTVAPSHRVVSLERAQTLESELPRALMELSLEVAAKEVVLQGVLEAASQLNRRWTLRDARGVFRRGVIEEGELGLDDLVIGGQYTFTCLERVVEGRSGRRRRPTLFLQSISEP